MKKRIMLLGSGELGKELVIAFQRLGQYCIAVDNYENAPAMQVAHTSEVINMLDGDQLDAIVKKHKPDIIVPEIEAIRTERFYTYEKQNIHVVPSAMAANFTMNRKAIRDLAAKKLGVKTANYNYASTLDEFRKSIELIGLPCVVKPLMSSSGKGQSILKNIADIEKTWHYAIEGSRGDVQEVIIEEFIPFDFEITLLTITQAQGETLFCQPIGHRQEQGDYRESWQPCAMPSDTLKKAEEIAEKVTCELKGEGVWGVEFFVKGNEVYFSELSPRPHDTGMVTLANTQNFNQFELHARAILQLPIPEIVQLENGASAVILAKNNASEFTISGIEDALKIPNSDVRVFGKPTTRPNRRMAVALYHTSPDTPIANVVEIAVKIADNIIIE